MARRSLLADDRAQATVEYILIIAVAVGLFLMVWRQFLKPLVASLTGTLQSSFNSFFASGQSMHTLPFKPPN